MWNSKQNAPNAWSEPMFPNKKWPTCLGQNVWQLKNLVGVIPITPSWCSHRRPSVNNFVTILSKQYSPNQNLKCNVNCTSFGCTLKSYFLITPKFCKIFLWEVLHMAINIIVWQQNFPNMSVTFNYHILISQTIIMSASIVIYKCS